MPTLKLVIDASKAKTGAAQFTGASNAVQGGAQKAELSVRKLLAVLGGVATIRKTIKVWSEFELTMKTLKGVSGATEEQFKALNETARELGATTQFSAKEAGEGLLFLARAGFSADEAIKALPSTLDLAVTGMLDLGTAADIASNVLSQFGLKASETERIVDTLTNTANNSNTNVSQLAEAMKLAGPVAGALGITVEETAAAIGVLGDSGIQASLAGTNLRGTFAALLKTTDGVEDSLRQMGLSIEDVNPEKHNLTEIFKKFGDANLTAGSAVEIFGRRNAASALILAKNAKRLEEITGLNEEAKGATAELAGEMRDTLHGSLKSLNSAFEEMILVGGDSGALGVFRSTVDVLADVIRLMSGAEAQMIEMNLITIELARQYDIAFAAIQLGWDQTVNSVTKILLGLERGYTVSINSIDNSWIGLTTAMETSWRSTFSIVEGVFNFMINSVKRGINDIVKTIINSGAAVVLLEKLGVTAQDLADTYTATITTNRTLAQEISKTASVAAKENEKAVEEANALKAVNEEELALVDQQIEAIDKRMSKRKDEFDKQVEGINRVAEASAFDLGEKRGTSQGPEDDEEKKGPTGLSPDEVREVEEEINAILTETQERRLEILSSGLSVEDQMRQEAFDKKREKEIERAEADKEFIEGLHESAFESEEQRLALLEDINAKHLDRMNKMEDEFHEERLKRDSKKWRMRLQGASQFLESAAILSEAFGNSELANSKAFGIAQAAVSTAIGISRALELGFPAAYPAMALAAATGAAQIATILGSSKGSGSINAPSAAGGAGSLAATATDSSSTAGVGAGGAEQTATIRVQGLEPGQLITSEAAEVMMNKMDELIDDDFRPRNIVVAK